MEQKNDRGSASFYMCPSCHRVVFDRDGEHSALNNPAPCCGSTAEGRTPWPPQSVCRLLDLAREEDIGTPEKFATSCIALCAATEVLMEICAAELLKLHAKSFRMIEFTLSHTRGLQALMELYDSVNDTGLQKLLEHASLQNFPKHTAALFRLRGRLVMERGYEPTDGDTETFAAVRERCGEAFALIYNDLRGHARPVHAASSASAPAVLVVEDEEQVLEYMVRLMRRHGFTVYSAATGRDAVQLFRDHRPGCVFLDVSLPDMSGLDILEGIKQVDAGARIYFVTGIGGEVFQKEAMKRGAAGYLPKPVDVQALVKLVQNI